MNVDNLDKKILYQLDIDARQSGKKIAKKLHVSKEVVNYRIRQMEKNGVIKGYYTLFDFSKLGYMLLRVYLKLKNTSLEKESEITDFFIKTQNTLWVAKTEGSCDMAVGYIVKSFKEFDESWKLFESRYKTHVMEKNISILYEFIHYRKSYLGGENKVKDVVGVSEKVRIDVIDNKIMGMIAADARKSLVSIAEHLSMTPANIRYRIKNLQKLGIILGYRVEIDLSQLDIRHYKIDIEVENIGSIGEAETFISTHPNVTYVNRTIGGSDMEFDVEVEGHENFLEIIDGIRKILGGNIRYLKYYISKDIVKILYYPENVTHS